MASSFGRSAKCRRCGQEIFWLPRHTGIYRPLGPKPKYMELDPDGKDLAYTQDGLEVRGRFIDAPQSGRYTLARPLHRCPYAHAVSTAERKPYKDTAEQEGA